MPKKSQPGNLAYDPMTYMGGRRRGKTGPETSSNGTRGRGDVTSTEWEVASKVAKQTMKKAGRTIKPKPTVGQALIGGAKKTLAEMSKPRRMNRGPL